MIVHLKKLYGTWKIRLTQYSIFHTFGRLTTEIPKLRIRTRFWEKGVLKFVEQIPFWIRISPIYTFTGKVSLWKLSLDSVYRYILLVVCTVMTIIVISSYCQSIYIYWTLYWWYKELNHGKLGKTSGQRMITYKCIHEVKKLCNIWYY